MGKREIKFRAWDGVSNKMCSVGSIEFVDKVEGRPGVNAFTNEKDIRKDHWIEMENLDLMQFTGLRDKNGVDIYEGDIVEWRDSSDNKRYWIGEVKFGEYFVETAGIHIKIKFSEEKTESDFCGYHI